MKNEKESIQKEKEIQEKYIELQMLEEQLKKYEEQINMLNNQAIEIENTLNALDELKNTKKGTEFFAPLSQGIFVKAELKENDNVLVNVGEKTIAAKTIGQTKELLQKQQDEVKNYLESLTVSFQKSAQRLTDLHNELLRYTSE